MAYAYATTSAPGLIRTALDHRGAVDLTPDQAVEFAEMLTDAAGIARNMAPVETSEGGMTVSNVVPLPLRIYRPKWLRASSFQTDRGLGVEVYRSVLVNDDSPVYAPVAAFIAANGLTLLAREEQEDDEMMHGTAERLLCGRA